MITVTTAIEKILSTVQPVGSTSLELSACIGRVLLEPVYADRDLPPYHRVTMDGIAIAYASFYSGNRHFPIQSTQQAGMPQQSLAQADHCIEVMTGAMLPKGTDTVIRYEDLEIAEGVAEINLQADQLTLRQNVHGQGEDRSKGSLLIPTGRRFSPAEIALAASTGHSQLTVNRFPQVGVFSSGDELIPIEQKPLPQQIRQSNGHMIQAALASWGIPSTIMHVPDQREAIRKGLEQLLAEKDALILSGGVSMGKADFLPRVLEELGVEKHFHKVAQRPGKPFWFGMQGPKPVFGLPGNPVSTFVNFIRYVLPWMRAAMGESLPTAEYAELAEPVNFPSNLTYFLQVRLESQSDGRLLAWPQKGNGSGDHANLLNGQAWMELPQERNDFSAGESFPIWRYR
ncbi:MAG: molybdopterin molybdotransferase MoeA [Bacteroidota bacterium]